MFCPTCGADSQTPKAYCRRCGEWIPDIKGRAGIAFGGETPQQNVFTGLFINALSALAALFSAIALYVTYLGTGDAKWSVYVAAACCLCIAGWQASSFIVGLKLRQRLKRLGQGSVAELDSRPSPPALGEPDLNSFVSVSSVTENTTEFLKRPDANPRDTQR
jgi:hypothetical protein